MMPMPFASGAPMRLSAQVAGSLSALQGQMMAAQPDVQNAYAMHWLAFRNASGRAEFEQMTQNMLWAAYSKLAMQGLLRQALSGRGTPEVMGGIIDQARIMQNSYRGATQALNQFLQTPENQQLPGVEPMTRALQPMDRFYQNIQGPVETVMQGVPWAPARTLGMVNMPMALIREAGTAGSEGGAGTEQQP